MKYLKIFTDFLDVVEPLDDEECGRLFKAMLGYSLDGREPQLTGNERFLWVVARQHMDREAEVYEKKVKHLKRGNVPVTEKKGSVSEQDKDRPRNGEKRLRIGARQRQRKRQRQRQGQRLSLFRRRWRAGGEREEAHPFGGDGILSTGGHPNGCGVLLQLL